MVIRSLVVKDGKNLEKQVMLSNITAARLGRSGRDNQVENDMVTIYLIAKRRRRRRRSQL